MEEEHKKSTEKSGAPAVTEPVQNIEQAAGITSPAKVAEEGDVKASTSAKIPVDPMAHALDACLDVMDKVRFCANEYIPAAQAYEKKTADALVLDLEKMLAAAKKNDREGVFEHLSQLGPDAFLKKIRLAVTTRSHEILARSLFIYLFSTFDAFTGDIVKSVFKLRPELLSSIDRSFSFQEVIDCASLDELKDRILDREIEQLRRDSYTEQFNALEQKFGIKTLRKFAHWPKFVECSQRRNLITHCDGVVSRQYLAVCKEAGYVAKTELCLARA